MRIYLINCPFTPNTGEVDFDGVGDALVVKDYPTFDITENMTFMAWF
ncbi:MAG: hypothetical protein OXH39_16770 [Candidatus Poribacteria bacterium]|nr:hypothetical protein [Candidatus Poribacteria bacterium]